MENKLRRKTILLIISVILLLAALITLSVAWYTRNVSLSKTVFNVGEWDSSANAQTGNFNVMVYANSSISGGMAAPGTKGEVPITLSASGSNADANFQISVDKSTLSDDFKKRLFFSSASGSSFYDSTKILETTSQSTSGTVAQGGTTTISIYWEWIYEYKDLLDTNTHLYNYGISYVAKDYLEYYNNLTTKTGWPTTFDGTNGLYSKRNTTGYKDKYNQFMTDMSKKFDEFDSAVGMNPDLYEQYMNATLKIYGSEVKPVTNVGE